MFDRVGDLAERVATNVSRRAFLGRPGQGALGLAPDCAGILTAPPQARAGNKQYCVYRLPANISANPLLLLPGRDWRLPVWWRVGEQPCGLPKSRVLKRKCARGQMVSTKEVHQCLTKSATPPRRWRPTCRGGIFWTLLAAGRERPPWPWPACSPRQQVRGRVRATKRAVSTALWQGGVAVPSASHWAPLALPALVVR
jgi:hypothetical protein